jgi:hypothetical protein
MQLYSQMIVPSSHYKRTLRRKPYFLSTLAAFGALYELQPFPRRFRPARRLVLASSTGSLAATTEGTLV